MANSLLYIPDLNPVRFYSETLKYPDNYRTRFFEDFNFQNQIKDFEERVVYKQKWMRDDVIHLQIETDFTNVIVQVVGCYETIHKTVTPVAVTSAIDPTPLQFRNVSITLADLEPGTYYLRIKVTWTGGFKYYSSEPFEVREVVENSMLIHYSNVTNDYDVAFDTDIVFQFRVEGGFTDFKPGSKRKVYEDQNLNNVRLSATPFKSYKLIIGGPEGVPNWVPDKVNRIFCCDYTVVDGRQFVRQDGDMEARREEYYPMAGWGFDLRETTNKFSKRFSLAALFGILNSNEDVLLDYNNNPLLPG